MELKHAVEHADIESLSPLLRERVSPAVLGFVRRFFGGLSKMLGLDVGVFLPQELAERDPTEWEGLLLIEKMKKLGIATSVRNPARRYEDEPGGYTTVINLSGERQRLGYSGSSRDLFNRSRTLWPAIGEAVERWSLEHSQPFSGEGLTSSYRALSRKKLDLFSVAGITGWDKNMPAQFNTDTIFYWVPARSIFTNEEVFLPLQLVSFSHVQKITAQRSEPLLAPTITTGAAVGRTLNEALLAGLLEVVERDAFMIYWLNKLSPEKIITDSFPDMRLQRMNKIAKRYRLETHLLYLKTDVPVHTVLSLVLDRTGVGPAVMVGAASGFDVCDTAYKSLSETLAAREHRRALMDEHKNDAMNLVKETLDHEKRLLYWDPVEKIQDASFLLRGGELHFKYIPRHPIPLAAEAAIAQLAPFFRENGYKVLYRKTLDEKLERKLGLTAVFVKVPEFQPLHLYEPAVSLSSRRLREVPKKIGLQSASLFNREPHPFP